MPSFTWKGKNRMGQMQEGVLVAESQEAAAASLRRHGVEALVLRPAVVPKGKGGGKIPPKTLALFTRQFSVMIDAGLPLVQCLEILAGQQEHKGFRQVLDEVREAVEKGASLQAALAQHPKVFDTLFVNMVGAGESGGILDIILQRLSTYIEKSVKITAKAKGAVIYPAVVLSFAAIVVGFIMVKVIPVFTQLFEGAGAKLPVLTRVCIAASSALVHYGWMLALGLVAAYLLVRQYRRTPSGRLAIDRLVLKLPIFGSIFQKLDVARFCRTLGTLISSGVPILEGMDITARTAGNQVIQNAILTCRDAVEQGRTVSGPLGETKVFPPMVVQMVGVGEATGALDAMLGKVADYYEDEVDNAVSNLASLMEPLLIILMGVTIGTIVVAMYLPIFNLADVFGKE